MSVLLSKGGWNVNGYGTDATNIKKILLGLLGIGKNAKNCFKVVFYVFSESLIIIFWEKFLEQNKVKGSVKVFSIIF